MSGVLVVAETSRGELRDITFELIGAGLAVKEDAGGRLAVAIVAADPESVARDVALSGVDDVILVTTPTEHFDPHLTQAALEGLIEAESPSLVLVGHTVDAFGYAPAVAVACGLGLATDVTALAWDDGPVACRPAYGGKLEAELEFPDRPCTLLTLRAGSFMPATGAAEIPSRHVEVAFDSTHATTHLSYGEAPVGDVDITRSEVLVSVGRGIGDRENLPRVEQLAERLGAALSASRPLVDAGWVPAARQVGQSGKTVKPRVYLALGISGAVQHVAGVRGAATIVAVNTDRQAPIFNVAQYGSTVDLLELVEALEAQLG